MKQSKYYKGNQFLPKSGTKWYLTPEQVEEYKKCKKDIIYFANTYFRVVSQDEGLVQMKLYDYQIVMLIFSYFWVLQHLKNIRS